MSLRHALLGLLAEGPASGYDLARQFDQGIGSFAWTAKHSQIYPELNRLAADGLVEVVAEGARGRRDYDLTPAGRAALREWLVGDYDAGGTVRNEFVLRLFLLSALDVADATVVLDDVEQYVVARIADVEEAQRRLVDLGLPNTYGPAMAAEYGARAYRATLDWARWARDELTQRG